jgi:hypothetical protein
LFLLLAPRLAAESGRNGFRRMNARLITYSPIRNSTMSKLLMPILR